MPEGTRQLLIAVAKRYRLVACVSGRRASEARAMVSIGTISYLGSHGAELLRAGWTEAVLDPAVEDWVRRIQEFGREADTADLRRLRVRLEDKGAIVAFHWRGAPDEEAARAAIDAIAAARGGRRPADPLGPQGARGPPAGADRQGRRDRDRSSTGSTSTSRCTSATTRPISTPSARSARLARRGGLQRAIRVGVRSDEGPSEITEEADIVVDGTEGVRELLTMLVAESSERPQQR